MKKLLAIVLALIMIVSALALPVFAASDETASDLVKSYNKILGLDASSRLYNDPWDWTNAENGPNTPNWNNFGAIGALPTYRMQTIYVPEGAEGQISINWLLVKGNLHQAICLNYDIVTGVLSQANYDFLSIVDVSEAVPEDQRTGYIQFITTNEYDPATEIVTQSTYANGKLILQSHTHDGAGNTLYSGVQYAFSCMNNDTTAFSGQSAAYLEQGVKTLNFLVWYNDEGNAPVSKRTVIDLYNLYAAHYNMKKIVLPVEAYAELLGEEASGKLFNEIYDWTLEDVCPYQTPLWNNFGAISTIPTYRIQTIYVDPTAEFTEDDVIGVNWLIPKNLHLAISHNYNLKTGEVIPANMDFVSIVDYSAPVPESMRSGYLQFIETADYNEATQVLTLSTYVNGQLVWRGHTHDGAGSLLATGIQWSYYCVNNNGQAFNGQADAYMSNKVTTISMTCWYNNGASGYDFNTGKAPVSAATVVALYEAFADYYGTDAWNAYRLYDENGNVVTGWVDTNGDGVEDAYYLKTPLRDEDGKVLTGVGVKVTEDKVIGGYNYTYNAATDTLEKRSGWWDTDGDGVNDSYYYKLTGVKAVEYGVTIGGVLYDCSGDVAETIQGMWWDEEDNAYFYIDGVKAGGWQDTDEDGEVDAYFYKESGIQCTESRMIGGQYYVWDDEMGTLERRCGWYDLDGDGVNETYYYIETGIQCQESRKIGGKMYNYDADTDTLTLAE